MAKNPRSGKQKRKGKREEREKYWAAVMKEQAKKEEAIRKKAEKEKAGQEKAEEEKEKEEELEE
jgi:hypothetical protein